MYKIRPVLTLILTAVLALPALADELTPTKRQLIERFMRETNVMGIAEMTTSALLSASLQSLRTQHPGLDADKLQLISNDISRAMTEQMMPVSEDFVLLYHRHYSQSDVEQLLAFYQSDLGRKLIAKTPIMVTEETQIGLRWGQLVTPQIARIVQDRLKSFGITN